MRHARMQSARAPGEITNEARLFANQDGDDPPGAVQLLTDAGWSLAETLHELKAPLPEDTAYRIELWHEDTPACRLTAETLREAYNKSREVWKAAPELGEPQPGELQTGEPQPGEPRSDESRPKLPAPESPYADHATVKSWLNAVRTSITTQIDRATAPAVDANDAGKRALVLVVVGHDPRMSWLLGDLIGKHRPPVPALSHTEMIACEWNGDKDAKPVWALSPTDTKAEAEVLAKVKSKMDTAKIFAGVLTAIMTFVAKNVGEIDEEWRETVGLVGIALLGAAVALYLVTMFWYDRLLMPTRFWAVKAPKEKARTIVLRRPPSSSAWVLFQNMQLVWKRCFIPATIAAGLGLSTYIVAASQPSGGWQWAVLAVGGAALVGVVVRIGWSSRPDLGVQD